eukprot:6520858-Prymnesium_polylepis.1
MPSPTLLPPPDSGRFGLFGGARHSGRGGRDKRGAQGGEKEGGGGDGAATRLLAANVLTSESLSH